VYVCVSVCVFLCAAVVLILITTLPPAI